MVSTVTRLQRLGSYARTLDHTLNAAGVTDWVCLSSNVSVQITGVATAITAIVERSTRNPAEAANPAPADEPITGNPFEGMVPSPYVEPGVAWWRVRVTDITGGEAVIALCGTAGEEN